MNKLSNNLLQKFYKANMLYKLIYINIAVFLIINILNIIGFLFQVNLNESINWIAIPANYIQFLKKPWTIFTYMYTHVLSTVSVLYRFRCRKVDSFELTLQLLVHVTT